MSSVEGSVMSLAQLVADSAAANPHALAVSSPQAQLTYGELDRLANVIARALRQAGVARGSRVALWTEKSVQVVAAMQAILRLGAAYVPIDPFNPPARVQLILRDCAVSAIVSRPALLASLPEPFNAPAFDIATLAGEAAMLSTGPVETPSVSANDNAFILYTSGSTGIPKGVCLSHRNALAFVQWAVAETRATAGDIFWSHAPFHFDLSVFDLYAAFSVGAAVHLIPESVAAAPALLNEFVRRHRISIWYSVPSALSLMIEDTTFAESCRPSLRVILFAGEVFPVKHLAKLHALDPEARLLNLYGPTETNVCTWYEVREQDFLGAETIPIGKACSGDRVWARKADGSEAQLGEEGELLVEGPSVMLGYWGRPPRGAAPYATGDRVRLRDDGNYVYLGRIDHMVKVRGFRVELGEIEAALLAHPRISEAAVVMVGSGLSLRLIAFIACGGKPAPAFLEMKRHSAERLARYMIPDDFRSLDQLPRTSTGKIDRTALAALAEELQPQRG